MEDMNNLLELKLEEGFDKIELTKLTELKELTKKLNEAAKAYYNSGVSLMTDAEYDREYERLEKLERGLHAHYSNSPTQRVGWKVMGKLPTITHPAPMLSLDKRKKVEDVREYFAPYDVYCSIKCDGLTTALDYEDGVLVRGTTRGDGWEGDDVTHNIIHIRNIPKYIPIKGTVRVRGEVVIKYSEFNRINEELKKKGEETYKHPRNLASGTLKTLDSKEAAKREMSFIAWDYEKGENKTLHYSENMKVLKEMGFEVAIGARMSCKIINDETAEMIKEKAEEAGVPIDGLVFTFNDVKYGERLGITGKFPKHSMAYKFEDEKYTTILEEVVWQVGRSGVVTPVAVFSPVDMDGAITTKATLHNLSIFEGLELGKGDEIVVYRSNQVIPAVEENITRSGGLEVIKNCPECGEELEVSVGKDGAKTLICTNEECKGKVIATICHYSSKGCMNITSLSKATVTMLYDMGAVRNVMDLYQLKEGDWYEKMINVRGFGEKKAKVLLKGIEDSKKCKLEVFIFSLGIPGIGKEQSKIIAEECGNWDDFIRKAKDKYDWTVIEGIGEVLSASINKWATKKGADAQKLAEMMEFQYRTQVKTNKFNGQTFCITGKLKRFSNREEMVEYITNGNGKVVSSVSKNTNYLINNDTESTSGKNKKAKELGVKIISEEELLNM